MLKNITINIRIVKINVDNFAEIQKYSLVFITWKYNRAESMGMISHPETLCGHSFCSLKEAAPCLLPYLKYFARLKCYILIFI